MKQRTSWCADKHVRPYGARHGQSIIEFALLLPVLAVVLIGVLDLGRMYYAYMSVVNAAREGARWGAAHPPALCPVDSNSHPAAKIILHTRQEALESKVSLGQLKVYVSCPDGSNDFGNTVKVEVRYNFQMVTASLLGAGPIMLKSAAQMQIFGRDPL